MSQNDDQWPGWHPQTQRSLVYCHRGEKTTEHFKISSFPSITSLPPSHPLSVLISHPRLHGAQLPPGSVSSAGRGGGSMHATQKGQPGLDFVRRRGACRRTLWAPIGLPGSSVTAGGSGARGGFLQHNTHTNTHPDSSHTSASTRGSVTTAPHESVTSFFCCHSPTTSVSLLVWLLLTHVCLCRRRCSNMK